MNNSADKSSVIALFAGSSLNTKSITKLSHQRGNYEYAMTFAKTWLSSVRSKKIRAT
jgi:hypothetical protein